MRTMAVPIDKDPTLADQQGVLVEVVQVPGEAPHRILSMLGAYQFLVLLIVYQ